MLPPLSDHGCRSRQLDRSPLSPVGSGVSLSGPATMLAAVASLSGRRVSCTTCPRHSLCTRYAIAPHSSTGNQACQQVLVSRFEIPYNGLEFPHRCAYAFLEPEHPDPSTHRLRWARSWLATRRHPSPYGLRLPGAINACNSPGRRPCRTLCHSDANVGFRGYGNAGC